MFVAMPSYKAGNRYRDVCFPITKEFREKTQRLRCLNLTAGKGQAVQEGRNVHHSRMQTDDRGFIESQRGAACRSARQNQ